MRNTSAGARYAYKPQAALQLQFNQRESGMVSVHKLILVLLMLGSSLASAAQPGAQISWQPWSDGIFEQARREHRLVLLDLEAVWCHWCHVMEEKTYHDSAVVKLINTHYLAVKVDQDANPDISLRYEDYGWPATVVFAVDGSEIVKRRGYIPPERMRAMLQAIVADPTPGPSVLADQAKPVVAADATHFRDRQREQILRIYKRGYDQANGGWSTIHKYILTPNMEYALQRAKQGDKKYAAMARQTLDAALNLIDPEWGGIYQYSDKVNWKSPHFEKIMAMQADNLRLYTQAYLLFDEPRYLKAARDIDRYLRDFLTSPEGAFYTSQNADVNMQIDGHAFYPLPDKQRRALGMPSIDTNIYARENGWAIRALAALHDATGDKDVLQRAVRAAQWVIEHRSLPGGGFRHGAKDRAGPYLGDTLAMGETFLALYASTGEREWLMKARASSEFIQANFASTNGFVTTVANPASKGVFRQPVVQMEENVAVARFANLLFHYTGDAKYHATAEHAVRYLVALAHDSTRYLAGALMAVEEFASDPAHITIVGGKSDTQAQALQAAAIRYASNYRRIEWWDKAEGALPNPDVQYPQLDQAAAFICVNNACSTPIFEPAKISAKADVLLGSEE